MRRKKRLSMRKAKEILRLRHEQHLSILTGDTWLMASLMYGAGLRLMGISTEKSVEEYEHRRGGAASCA